jgi:hypothetical protein
MLPVFFITMIHCEKSTYFFLQQNVHYSFSLIHFCPPSIKSSLDLALNTCCPQVLYALYEVQ